MSKSVALIRLLAVVVGLGLLMTTPRWTADDAYISFRYAHNLITHGQLTWNIGQPPVEGYTGIAWPVLLAVLMRLGVAPEVGSQVMGVLAFGLSALVLFLLLRRLGTAEPARSFLVLLYVAAPFLYTHMYGGLETMLFVLMVLASLLVLTMARPVALVLCLLVVSLVRPEGVVLAALCICALVIDLYRRDGRISPRLLATVVLVYVLPAAVYFQWRWGYYGQLLPNTAYAKMYVGLINWEVTTNLGEFAVQYLLCPALGVTVSCLLAWRSFRSQLRQTALPSVCVVSCAFMLLVLALYVRSDLIMNYSYRFFAPMFPLTLLLLGILAPTDIRAIWRLDRWRLATALAVAGFLAIGQTVFNAGAIISERTMTAENRLLLEAEHIPAGRYVREHLPTDEWLIVHLDAGAISYFSERRTVDFGGLNDPFLARKNVSLQERVDYFFAHQPGAAVFTSYAWDHLDHGPEATAILADSRFQAYVLADRFGNDVQQAYYQFVYMRKDLAH